MQNVEEVKEEIRQIIDELGEDTVYSSTSADVEAYRKFLKAQGADSSILTDTGVNCFYVNYLENTPGCIVGHYLNRMGIPLTQLSRYEGTGASKVIAETGLEMEFDALERLDELQNYQDSGVNWGDAFMHTFEPEIYYSDED